MKQTQTSRWRWPGGLLMALGLSSTGLAQPAAQPAQPIQSLQTAHKAGATFRDCPRCGVMVVVPAGRVPQTDPVVRFARPFALSRNLVTVAQWQACVLDLFCAPLPAAISGGNRAAPVTQISHEEAERFADWVSHKTLHRYHLPSQSQWRMAQLADPPVVREWTEDCWSDDESLMPDDGTSYLVGPSRCQQRVVMGRQDGVVASPSRNWSRTAVEGKSGHDNVGFRLAREIDLYESLPLASISVQEETFEDLNLGMSAREIQQLTAEVAAGMKPLPAGRYLFGQVAEGDEGEPGEERSAPLREERVEAFEIGRTEVTQKLWTKVMGKNPSYYQHCGPDCQVENVSWGEVQVFLDRLNQLTHAHYRLPSEAEWEYACRAGQNQRYCGSDDPHEVGWYVRNSREQTHPVARKTANAWGLYDMTGNVWEWVEDRWGQKAEPNPRPGRNKRSRPELSKRVYRGGSWLNQDQYVRLTYRYFGVTSMRLSDLGFRLARSLP
jgi:formylglycine-generating enzyme required for sulfatase activity